MIKKTIYVWTLVEVEYAAIKTLVRWGVTDSSIELPVSHVIPKCGSGADRKLSEMED